MTDFPWIIDAAAARALLAQGAVVVDARRDHLRTETPLPDAVPLLWTRLTHAEPSDKGRLLEDDGVLSRILTEAGISQELPVLVVGDSLRGGGEDGRLVWALRTLGHSRVALIDGGIAALLEQAVPQFRSAEGGFSVRRNGRWEISREELRDQVAQGAVAVLDTREAREYGGETPNGESRGGTVPGARHLWYRDLIGEDGRILARDAVVDKLRRLGVGTDVEVVAFCTGGVRAAFVTTVLTQYGYRVRNYAGSMWHWAAGAADTYPLVPGTPA